MAGRYQPCQMRDAWQTSRLRAKAAFDRTLPHESRVHRCGTQVHLQALTRQARSGFTDQRGEYVKPV